MEAEWSTRWQGVLGKSQSQRESKKIEQEVAGRSLVRVRGSVCGGELEHNVASGSQ
jgi:hypothetical protein